MNHNEAPPLASYPSPPAPGHNGFYPSSAMPQDQRQPDPEGLQLAAQLSGSLAEPMMRQNDADAAAHAQLQMDANRNNHYEGQGQQAQNHQQINNHEGMDHGMGGGQAYGTPGTPIEQKKRTKVSRACDECRRKKIRCDSFSEDEQCSNCKRIHKPCQFSRIPQKRGPSKGYIKELSDRVNNLEASARMHPGEAPYASMNPQGASPRAFDEFSPGPGNKRAYSAISNDINNSPYPGYRQEWSNQNQQRQPSSSGYQSVQPPAGSIVDPSYPSISPDDMAPQPAWRNAPDGARQIGASLETASQNGHNQAGRHLDWEGVLDRYYHRTHVLLPLLPSSKPQFYERVSRPNCPAIIEEALYDAVQSVNSCVEGAPRPESVNSRSVFDDAIKSLLDAPSSRTMATNILYLQVLLFRVIEADVLGPDSTTQKNFWLGIAVSLAANMKLHESIRTENYGGLDPDSDEGLGRRVWWCLVILERWRAASSATIIMIPESSVVLVNEDKAVLGATTYELARFSITQGHLASILAIPSKSSDTTYAGAPFLPAISMILNGELERCRESLHIVSEYVHSILRLNVLCLRLLYRRMDPSREPVDLFEVAVQIAKLLSRDDSNPDNNHHPTPFNHHFAAVAAFTLVELRDVHGMEECNEHIQLLTESVVGRIVNSQGRDWHSAMMNLINKQDPASLDSQPGQDAQGASLHHLADLATADSHQSKTSNTGQNQAEADGTKEAHTPETWDSSLLVRTGYLGVLASHLPPLPQQ